MPMITIFRYLEDLAYSMVKRWFYPWQQRDPLEEAATTLYARRVAAWKRAPITDTR